MAGAAGQGGLQGKKTGWVTRTQGLVMRGDLAAKRKASSGSFFFLSHAVEAGEQTEGTAQRAAALSWSHRLSATVPWGDILPNEITSQSLLPGFRISRV